MFIAQFQNIATFDCGRSSRSHINLLISQHFLFRVVVAKRNDSIECSGFCKLNHQKFFHCCCCILLFFTVSSLKIKTFVEKVIGEYSWVISIFVCLSCLGYINGGFLSASRTIFGAVSSICWRIKEGNKMKSYLFKLLWKARKNHMPKCLAFINIKFLTPITSILFLVNICLI